MHRSHLALLATASLSLAACDTVPPKWNPYPPQEVTVGQSTFQVRQNGAHVLALRTNSEWAPNIRSVSPRAVQAIEHVTGCKVSPGSLRGDAAMMTALVRCGDSDEVDRILQERRIIEGVAEIMMGG